MVERSILVLGAGNFGTALGHHLAMQGHKTTIWCRSQESSKSINQNHRNPKYLQNYQLSPKLRATTDLPTRDNEFEVIVIAIPTQFMRSVLAKMNKAVGVNTKIVCAAKGIELDTLSMPIAIVKETFSAVREDNIAVLSGPSFASEIVERQPTAVSIASQSVDSADYIQEIFHSETFRAYTTQDVIGLEIAGALKNVIALAAGAASGLGLANNSKAALLTRGLAEITRIGVALGANPITFNGLGGVGDLFLTCTSTKSRNFSAGFGIGQGKKLETVVAELGSVAEGVATTEAAYRLTVKLDVDAPITNTVFEVLYRGLNIDDALAKLLGRNKKPEVTYP